MFAEFGELQRQCQGQHCFEGYAERSGVMAPSVLVLSLVPQQLPPALQFWHRARTCLPPEPLPAPLHQQLLPQSWESSMTVGTNVSGAHLQSVPCPWLHACGSVPCYAGGSQMVPLNGTLFFTAEAAVRLLFHPATFRSAVSSVVFSRHMFIFNISGLRGVKNSTGDLCRV